MRFIFEENQVLSHLCDTFRTRTSILFDGITPAISGAVLSIGDDCSGLASTAGIAVLREGMLSVTLDGQNLLVLEEGDLLPAAQLRDAGLSIAGEFAVIYDLYQFDQFDTGPDGTARMFTCLGLQQALVVRLVASLSKGERQVSPTVRTVSQGDIIIREGEKSDQIFTLLEGRAEVLSGDVVVGEVKADELIGVIGALCDVPRIATVRAASDVLLMSIGKDEFIDLLSLRPHMIVKLIADFARIISSSNQALRRTAAGPENTGAGAATL